MHVCFHGGGGGGGGDSRITKSIGVIRGFTKNMKAMSLKVKVGGGGNHVRARRWRPPEADGQVQDYRDVAAAASSSAKIAPAQLKEETDYDHQPHKEEERGGGKKQCCDKCCSPLLDDGGGEGAKKEEEAAAACVMVTAEEESGREWVAEPEPGVLMTLVPRPNGTNRLRRIQFREALFDAWAAQSWWADNYDRVVELYSVVQSDEEEEEESVVQSDEEEEEEAVPVTPCHSEEDELPDGMTGASPSASNVSCGPSSGSGGGSAGTVGSPILGLVTARNASGNGSAATAIGRAAQHDQPTTPWREWVEEYEDGVLITVRAYPDHPLQLQRVELSRERFGEVKARVWWQENKARLHHLYSF